MMETPRLALPLTLILKRMYDDRRVSWYVNTCAVGVYILPVSTIFSDGVVFFRFLFVCLFVCCCCFSVFCFLI
jgi:hypothetical protein